MSDEKEENIRLAQILLREYLRNAKLTGGLEKIGFDITDYKLCLMDEIVLLLGQKELTDDVCDVVEIYEEEAVKLSYYDFPEKLDNMASVLINEIFRISEEERGINRN